MYFFNSENIDPLKFVLRVFQDVPDKNLVESILSIDEEDIDKTLKEIQEEITSLGIEESLDRYNNEFLELFVQPRNLSTLPYASYHLKQEKNLSIDYLNELKSFYAEHLYKTIPPYTEDHIATQLSFLLSNDIKDDVKAYFFENHLYKWIPTFCQNVITYSKYKYFQNTSLLLLNISESVM
jgi:TorA maturation chaperone TorD